ncbi:MAG: polysaccharide deacetylase family protein [Acidimicrobiales bacterium]
MINICFHGIGIPGRRLEPGEDRYWIRSDTYYTLLDEIASRSDVHVSFDDGNASDVEIGLPGLLERGLSASFFVVAGRVGGAGSLCQDELRELQRQGMEIGSHGMDHRPWPDLRNEARHDELEGARHRLEELLDAKVDTAAVPLGRYNRRLLNDLKRLGYRRVYTSDRRHSCSPDAWLQPRFSVRKQDTVSNLRAEVLGQPPASRRLTTNVKSIYKRLI